MHGGEQPLCFMLLVPTYHMLYAFVRQTCNKLSGFRAVSYFALEDLAATAAVHMLSRLYQLQSLNNRESCIAVPLRCALQETKTVLWEMTTQVSISWFCCYCIGRLQG